MASIDHVPPSTHGTGHDTGHGTGQVTAHRAAHRTRRRLRQRWRRAQLVRTGGLIGAAIAAGSVILPWYSADNHRAVPALFPPGSRTAHSALDVAPRHAWIALAGALLGAVLLAWPRQTRTSFGGRALTVESSASPLAAMSGLGLAINVMWATIWRPPVLADTLDPWWGLAVAMFGAVILTVAAVWMTAAERSGDA